MGTAVRVAVATGGGATGSYSRILFTGWDYGCQGDRATKLKQKSIHYQLQVRGYAIFLVRDVSIPYEHKMFMKPLNIDHSFPLCLLLSMPLSLSLHLAVSVFLYLSSPDGSRRGKVKEPGCISDFEAEDISVFIAGFPVSPCPRPHYGSLLWHFPRHCLQPGP